MDMPIVYVYRIRSIWHGAFMQGDWETREEADAFMFRNDLSRIDWYVDKVAEVKNPQWND